MKIAEFVPWLFSRWGTPLVTIAVSGPAARRHVVGVTHLPIVIGRGVDADVRVTDSWVSKVHCCLDVADGKLIVRDAESRHGTLVNGETIQSHALKAGDEILVGMSKIEIIEIADKYCAVTFRESSSHCSC